MENKKSKRTSKKGMALLAGIGAVLVIATVVLVIVLSGGHRVIKINSYSGTVSLERANEAMEIMQNMNLKSEDVITTGTDGIMELLLDTDKTVLAQSDTRFSILASGNEKRGKLHIKLEYGTALMKIDNKLPEKSIFEVETPNASMSVRGTTFSASYNAQDNVSVVITNDGVVEVTAGDTTVPVNAGEMAIVEDDTVTVEEVPFVYKANTLFEVTSSKNNEGSALYVKELEGWTYETSYVQNIKINELVRDNLALRYLYVDEEYYEEDIETAKTLGYFVASGKMVNTDGDDIYWLSTGSDGEAKAYHLFKEYSEGCYLRLYVYQLNFSSFEEGDTIDKFLILTNDCYYVMEGEPEAITEENTEAQAETDVPGTIVTKEEIPALLAGDINYEELEFMIRVADTIRMHPGYSLAWQALDIMRYEPSLAGVYEPISGTSLSYDAEHLNGMFPAFTVKRIEQGDLPQYAKLENGVVTLQPATEPRKFVNTTQITSMYIDGEDNLWIEYTFDDKTEKVTGTAACVMTRNEEGKYHLNYLMEYERQAY